MSIDLSSLLTSATALHQQGQLAKAKTLCEQILQANPRHPGALHLLGIIAAQSGNSAEAVQLIDTAIAIFPNNPGFHHNRGGVLHGLGQLDAAIFSYDKAIAIKPDFADAYAKRGVALHDLRQLDAAIASYDKALAIKPDSVEAHYNRGLALQELKQLDAAIASYDNAIAIVPNFAEAYSNRGLALQELKHLDAAIASCDKAIAIKPDCAAAYSNRGLALQELTQLDAAIASYDQAIAIKPDYAEAHYNRGVALHDLKHLDAAIASYDRAIAIRPDYAEAQWNKSLTYLLRGNFEIGWALYEWRWKRHAFAPEKRDFSQPLWLGEKALAGKTILLHSEQGYGDIIQFCRYVPLVAGMGARVILETPKSLLGLLRGLNGVSDLVPWRGPLPSFDLHCPLMSLSLAFKTTLDSIPAPASYLKSDPSKCATWANRLGVKTMPRVGLVWRGNTANRNDRNRSISLSALIPHLPRGIQYVSLQKEIAAADQPTLQANPDILHFGDGFGDFANTAAACDQMDVVISVDTSIAHLSGALGKNTWIMLPFVPDWRWLLDTNDSPWYPSARLYRQESRGDWESVFKNVRADLIALLGQ